MLNKIHKKKKKKKKQKKKKTKQKKLFRLRVYFQKRFIIFPLLNTKSDIRISLLNKSITFQGTTYRSGTYKKYFILQACANFLLSPSRHITFLLQPFSKVVINCLYLKFHLINVAKCSNMNINLRSKNVHLAGINNKYSVSCPLFIKYLDNTAYCHVIIYSIIGNV